MAGADAMLRKATAVEIEEDPDEADPIKVSEVMRRPSPAKLTNLAVNVC
jgi:hypothetical protein